MSAREFKITSGLPPTNSELEQGFNLCAEAIGTMKQHVASLIALTTKQGKQIDALLTGNAVLTQQVEQLRKDLTGDGR